MCVKYIEKSKRGNKLIKVILFLVIGHLGWDKPKRKVSHLLSRWHILKLESLVDRTSGGLKERGRRKND